MTENKVN